MTDWIDEGDLEDFLGVTLAPALAADLVAAAHARVRKYLGQELTLVEDDVVFLDGGGRDQLRLPERPATLVSSVLEDGDAVPPGVYPNHEWMLESDRAILYRVNPWPVGRRNIKVTYDHGWDPDPIYGNFPADLRLVTLNFARRVFNTWAKSSEVSGSAKVSETIGAYSYTVGEAVAAASSVDFAGAEQAVLDAYRMGGPASGSKS